MPKTPPRTQYPTPSPFLPVVPSGWVEREIGINVTGEGGKWVIHRLKAHCKGPLAVHYYQIPGDKTGDWVVTAIPSRLRVIGVGKELDAYRIAEVLLGRCRMCLQSPTQEKARDTAPKWMIPWLKECQMRKQYHPHPFEQADE